MPVPSYVMPTARAICEVLDLRPKLRGYQPDGHGWIVIDGGQTTLKWDGVSITAAMTDFPAELFCVFPQVNVGGAEHIVPRFDVKVPWATYNARPDMLASLEQAFGKGKIALNNNDKGRAIFATTQRREVSRDEVASSRWAVWYRDRVIWTVRAMGDFFGADGCAS